MGTDIIKLLCKQGVLNKDSDYNSLMAGQVSTFSYIKKKIEKLQITPAQLALDPCSASAVIVYKDSGKVAACVSYPGYDNNRLANQMDTSYYNQLLNDRSLPLYNRATMQLTAPGSTFKPVTIIAGIQEGVISPGTNIFCDGVFDKLSPSLSCWNHSGQFQFLIFCPYEKVLHIPGVLKVPSYHYIPCCLMFPSCMIFHINNHYMKTVLL